CARQLSTVALGLALGALPATSGAVCVGDCDSSGNVTVNELVTMVNIALGSVPAANCAAGDANRDGQITINEIVQAVSSALNGCPITPTGTPTPSPTSTPTATPITAAVRSAPYDVGDTGQPHQLSIFNASPGGGSVGMPLGFGDVDGDGHEDFIACPMLADSGPNRDRRDSGEVHIYFGNGVISGVVVNSPDADNITTIMGARAGDLLGNIVQVSDVNADGLADILIGAQNYDGLAGDRMNAGGVFLYYGQPQRPRTVDLAALPPGSATILTIAGTEAGDRLGVWVTTGDVDGDGTTDLLLGADQADGPNNARPDTGAIYIIFGGQPLPATIDLAAPGDLRVATIHGVDAGDHFGSTIIAADVNGDGADDILAAGGLARGSSQIQGAFLAGGDGPANDRPDAGEVYLLFSAAPFPGVQDLAVLPAADRLRMYGANPSDVAGEELAVGDLDGDGQIDLAIGSLQASGPGGPESPRGPATGRTYVVFGAANRRGQAIDFANPGPGVTTIFGRGRGGISGDTLAIVDMDGDGIDDLWDASPMLGTRDAAGTFRPAAGMLDILFGQDAWPATIDLLLPADDLRSVQIYGADANDQFAYALAPGDANGDGKVDVISNAMAGDGFENQVPDAGELYVIDNSVLFDGATGPLPPLFLNIDIQPIFAATCLPCHGGDTPDGDLRLDAIRHSSVDLLGADSMGRQSTEVDDLLVRAGDPDASYLIEKIEATAARPPRVGDPMPLPPAPRLPVGVIAEIRRWISAGAPIANEELPPPPPPPAPPAQGFSTTFFTRPRFVLSDPALGEIESILVGAPAPIPLRLIGSRLTVPAAEFNTITIPAGEFGDVDVDIQHDGSGTINRSDGTIELSITFTETAIGGAVEISLPVTLTTGAAAAGPFTTQGQPLDLAGGTLKLVGIAIIPADTAIVGGDPVLVELEGSVAPTVPPFPDLTNEIQPIFAASCAFVNCHVGDGAAGLNLEPGRAFAELVGVPSTQVRDLLVVAGDPDSSYLFEKVASDTPRFGDRMPIGNALDPLDVDAIRQWILGGARE
ncbi:MAG: hypothetical protein ACE5I7_09645, partial [Candidatus Binatia bacterium]